MGGAMTKQDYETPFELFDSIDIEYNFTIDAAATAANATCPRFISPEQNALLWTPDEPETIWLNPPYANVGPWLTAIRRWTTVGRSTVTMLVQDRTDTGWWLESWTLADRLWFLTPRVAFSGLDQNSRGSALWHFPVGGHTGRPIVNMWEWKEQRLPL